MLDLCYSLVILCGIKIFLDLFSPLINIIYPLIEFIHFVPLLHLQNIAILNWLTMYLVYRQIWIVKSNVSSVGPSSERFFFSLSDEGPIYMYTRNIRLYYLHIIVNLHSMTCYYAYSFVTERTAFMTMYLPEQRHGEK